MNKITIIFLILLYNVAYSYKGDFGTTFALNSIFFHSDITGSFESDSKHVSNGDYLFNFENQLFVIEAAIDYEMTNMIAIGANGTFIRTKSNSSFFHALMVDQSAFGQNASVSFAVINGLLKMQNKSEITPFIGLGIGITSYYIFSYNAVSPIYQAMVGGDIAITESFAITGTYKYNSVAKSEFSITAASFFESPTVVKIEDIKGILKMQRTPIHTFSIGIKFIF